MLGADDIIVSVIWGKYFIESNGYTLHSIVLFQDNKSTMIMKNDGCVSSRKRNKHTKARYLLIVDKNDKR